jgi:hypothetical protein
MSGIIRQTAFIYGLTIVISMLVAVMIIILNKMLFAMEDAKKRRAEAKAANINGKAA